VTRFLIVPIRVADDVTLARYAIQAAHAEEGLLIVLDLTDARPGVVPDWARLLQEFGRTAAGNRQQFVVLATEPGLKELFAASGQGDQGTVLRRHDHLVACLEALGPQAGDALAVELSLPARMSYLPFVRTYLSSLLRRAHGAANAFRIEILVDELCLNAVENSPSDQNSYELAFRCAGGVVEMDVTNVFDDSINSERIMQRRLKTFDASGDYLGERGRGLFLIARLADGLQIKSLEGDRIQVSVLKRLTDDVVEKSAQS
jgi:anti-sigma regulatory factor (Ser/Thr protein kinase)